MLYIQNTTILSPQQRINNGAVLIDGERIAAMGTAENVPCPPGAQVIPAQEMTLAPGFIELQLNGGFGHDFTADPSTIWQVADQLPRYGVTAFLPTVITSPLANIATAQKVLDNKPAGFAGATPLGLHIEGPFLNPKKKGAHKKEYLRQPTLSAIEDWSPERNVRLATLAPELPGALDLIRALTARGVVVSSGHTMATYEQAKAGFDAGTRYGTHLFNVMPPLHHREPGLIGALLSDQRLTVGLINDGIHVHPAVVETVWHVLSSRRLSLVTDAMAAMGMPAGKYVLGELEVIVDETSARLKDGTLAGSILTLDAALRNLMAFTGCTFQDALPTVTTTPATLLGLCAERGSVTPGMRADLVLLSADQQVIKTIVGGQVVYSK